MQTRSGGTDTVLVTESEESRRNAAVEALTDRDFSLRTAETRAATLSVLDDLSVDCVVAGSEVEDGDYRDLIRGVGARDPTIPIVVCAPEVSVADALDSGASDRVSAPDSDEFVPRVRRAIERRDQLRADTSTRGAAQTDAQAELANSSLDGKRSREELERESSMLNSLLSQTPVSIYFKDKRGRHVRVSDSVPGKSDDEHIKNVEGKVHKTPEDVVGKTDFDLYHTETAVGATADDRYVMETESPIVDKVESYAPVEKYGWRVFTSTSKAPWYDSDGELAGTVGVTLDITQQKEYEKRLEQQNERLERFADVLSHDIRNPLNVAKGNLDVIASDVDPERLDAVDRSLDRIEELISDILEVALHGLVVEETETVELESVATDAWGTVDTGDEMTLNVDSTKSIRADRSRLQRLFENLFRNASEHAGPAVEVSVGALPEGFYVEDDGPGIPEDERESVLEQGFTTGATGAGFGLTIVRQIAEAHDWEVVVDESDAGGARFEIVGRDVALCNP